MLVIKLSLILVYFGFLLAYEILLNLILYIQQLIHVLTSRIGDVHFITNFFQAQSHRSKRQQHRVIPSLLLNTTSTKNST